MYLIVYFFNRNELFIERSPASIWMFDHIASFRGTGHLISGWGRSQIKCVNKNISFNWCTTP